MGSKSVRDENAKLLEDVVAFHAEWAKRPHPAHRGGLKLALFRERLELFRGLKRQASLMRQLPNAVLADWPGSKPRGIGEQTLRDLMPQIVAAWRQSPTPLPQFDKFVNRLLVECQSAKGLREKLGDASGDR